MIPCGSILKTSLVRDFNFDNWIPLLTLEQLKMLHAIYVIYFRMGALSADGICKSFDDSADGYGRSDAMVVVLLERAKDAKRVYCKV